MVEQRASPSSPTHLFWNQNIETLLTSLPHNPLRGRDGKLAGSHEADDAQATGARALALGDARSVFKGDSRLAAKDLVERASIDGVLGEGSLMERIGATPMGERGATPMWEREGLLRRWWDAQGEGA
ncbi:unnamed protein product [Ilex paraguariensis]|uniref:Uncharacterized protein n=1 Tax=Ilex paraguariensis TaxID=185542 RepID=A0ABC8QYF8_9AQUA